MSDKSKLRKDLIKELKYVQSLKFCKCCGKGIGPHEKFCSNCGTNLKYNLLGKVVFVCQECGAVYKHKPLKKHHCWVCKGKNCVEPKLLEN